jgi:radical SAM-linked protein
LTRRSREGMIEAMQRLRLRFSRGDEVKYISHLDLMRVWDRALRRAAIPVAYSEGFTPHPRISLGAALPVGVTSQAELMDIGLRRPVSPNVVIRTVAEQLPRGIDILEVEQVPLGSPSLQSQLRYAEYHVVVETDRSEQEMQAAIDALLKAESLPWQHMRDTGPRRYDLRPLIKHIWLVGQQPSAFIVGMRLRCDPQGTGRPEQVAAALELTEPPVSIHRTKLTLADK